MRLVPYADLKVLDPFFTTAYITRNFGFMVYDTLFAPDAKGNPQPQMVASYKTSPDGKSWTFTLRDGLKFSDGNPVRSADVVASLQRWEKRDNIGRAMVAAGGKWAAVDDKTFTLTLDQPFGPVLDGLAKVASYPAFIIPERLAKMPDTAPLNEVVGSARTCSSATNGCPAASWCSCATPPTWAAATRRQAWPATRRPIWIASNGPSCCGFQQRHRRAEEQ